MRSTLPRTVSALVLALAAGTAIATASTPTRLNTAQLATIKTQKPVRVQQATAQVRQMRNQFGLDDRSDFVPARTVINDQGRTVVRFKQTYEGLRVWGGEAISHVEADGQVKVLNQGVKPAVTLAMTTPRLSPEQARDLAIHHLAPKGPMGATPKVEAVIFPSRSTGGWATRFDAKKHAPVLDASMSVWAKAPSEPYVQAYEVKTLLANTKDGHKEINFIIDANTGAVLRKWNALQGDTPTQGTGNSHYRGTVPLSTLQAADGTFTLQATDRGTLPNPYVLDQGVSQIGLTTYYGIIDWNAGLMGFVPYAGLNTTNTWGDGGVMALPWNLNAGPWDMPLLLDSNADGSISWLQGALTPTGETAAVDAHYGLSTTWDFYKNVFGRDGIDNQGTSTFAIVHSIEGNGLLFDNAYWDPYYFAMHFGEGSYPTYAEGYMSGITELDITGHELTHGVTQYSVGADAEGLHYWDQSGGLNEATSDMMGKMVQAYADGGTTGATIPDFPTGDLASWEIGRNSAAPAYGALRFMYKPSLDGLSTDNWYDGIENLDVHFSSGAPNRFFFFLCAGASSNAASDTYSPYLPGGMTGIGNDKAARIWYKTLTEHLVPDSDFASAREGSILAAQELFGAGSPEELAVMKAWMAVNVGVLPGMPEPVRVSFPVVHPAGSFIDTNASPSGILAKVQLFPTRANVVVKADVRNTTNTKVTMSQPTWSFWNGVEVGTINPDGSWSTPTWAFYEDLINVTAISQADPHQYAKSYVVLVPADADQDGETDAFDMATVAMSWGLPETPFNGANVTVPGAVGDWDIVFLGESVANAYPVK